LTGDVAAYGLGAPAHRERREQQHDIMACRRRITLAATGVLVARQIFADAGDSQYFKTSSTRYDSIRTIHAGKLGPRINGRLSGCD